MFFETRTREAISVRPIESIYWAIGVRFRTTPGLFGRLIGRQPTFEDRVYTGNHTWFDAATGVRARLGLEDWLQNVLDGHQAKLRYERSTKDLT